MRQFVSSNIWTSEMMAPKGFSKEQVFAMCERLRDVCIWNEVFLSLESKYGDWNLENIKDEPFLKMARLTTKETLEKIKNILKVIKDDIEEKKEIDINDDNIEKIMKTAVSRIKLPEKTRDALHKLFPLMFDWKLKDLEKLYKYYDLVLSHWNDLKKILSNPQAPSYLCFSDIKNGLTIIRKNIKNMLEEGENNVRKMELTIDEEKRLRDIVLLIYPEGLVTGSYYCNMSSESGHNDLFWALAKLHPKKFANPTLKEYTVSNLAREILAKSFFDNGEYSYQSDNNSVILTRDEIEKSDGSSLAEEFLEYYNEQRYRLKVKPIMSKNIKNSLNNIGKQLDTVCRSANDFWDLDLKLFLKKNPQETLSLIKILYHYSNYIEQDSKITKDIFHILKIPSYENSIIDLLNKNTRNGWMLFYLKNDLEAFLRYNKKENVVKDISYIISRTYLDYNKCVDFTKWFFAIEGISPNKYKSMDEQLAWLLFQKRYCLHCMQMEYYHEYTEIFPLYEKESSPAELIYLSISAFDYIGLISDKNLLYRNMRKWIVQIPDSSIVELLSEQMKLANQPPTEFDFVKQMKSYSESIARIVEPDNIEKRSKEIKRYANKCFNIWLAVLEWYPYSDWGKKYDAYADFGTMVALVQLEHHLRKGEINIKYLSAYKGDQGKELRVHFYGEELPKDRIAVEIIMNLLFVQILSNFGLRYSIRVMQNLFCAYGRQYIKLLRTNNLERLKITDYAEDERMPIALSISNEWMKIKETFEYKYRNILHNLKENSKK